MSVFRLAAFVVPAQHDNPPSEATQHARIGLGNTAVTRLQLLVLRSLKHQRAVIELSGTTHPTDQSRPSRFSGDLTELERRWRPLTPLAACFKP